MRSKELVAVAQFGLARTATGREEWEAASRYGRLALDTFIEMGHLQVQQVQEWLQTLPEIDDE